MTDSYDNNYLTATATSPQVQSRHEFPAILLRPWIGNVAYVLLLTETSHVCWGIFAIPNPLACLYPTALQIE